MRLLHSLFISLILTLGTAQAYEPKQSIDLASMAKAYNNGNYPMAQYIGCRLLKQAPGNLAVHYLLGNCYVKCSQLDKATAQYKYCAEQGKGSQIGTFACTALDQISALPKSPQDATAAATGPAASPAGSLVESSVESSASPAKAQAYSTSSPAKLAAPAESDRPPPDRVDLQTLEYKERLLKTGADLIAANKVKLQRQIETLKANADAGVQDLDGQIPSGANRMAAMAAYGPARERLLNQTAARIKQLEEDNEAEERAITAYYQSQADKISSQKGNLNSQVQVGRGDTRLVQKGSGLFVHNYINFRGEVALPPPPPELRATARKLNPDPSTKNKAGHD